MLPGSQITEPRRFPNSLSGQPMKAPSSLNFAQRLLKPHRRDFVLWTRKKHHCISMRPGSISDNVSRGFFSGKLTHNHSTPIWLSFFFESHRAFSVKICYFVLCEVGRWGVGVKLLINSISMIWTVFCQNISDDSQLVFAAILGSG